MIEKILTILLHLSIIIPTGRSLENRWLNISCLLLHSGILSLERVPIPLAWTQLYPWDEPSDFNTRAFQKVDAAFEFLTKMGFDYFCFHDFDLVKEGLTLLESEKS